MVGCDVAEEGVELGGMAVVELGEGQEGADELVFEGVEGVVVVSAVVEDVEVNCMSYEGEVVLEQGVLPDDAGQIFE